MPWLIFILWIITIETALGKYKGRYTRQVKEYEVIVPTKVSEEGNFISYYLPHFYNIARVKRGADTGKVHYVVPIEGEEKVLELLPTEDFHAPGLVIEHHTNDAKLNVNSVKIRKPRPARCYYNGFVRNEPKSSAAISACSGLAGFIKINNEQYLIEPIDEEGKPTVDNKHKHILYKRCAQMEFNNRTRCGTTGKFKESFKRRMEWEAKFGKKLEEAIKGNYATSNDHVKGLIDQQNHGRHKKFCSTCQPNEMIKCMTPPTPCKVERPLFIELLIVVGPRVAQVQFIDDDMEQYVNTIVNIAVRHFQDSSLGRPILVKLVRIITMGFVYEDLDAKRYSPQDILQRFCEWQMHFNPRMEDHPNHHDFAIYLVKFEPCQGTGATLGLTNMASMCRPDKACAVIGEEGLLTGNMITHILGHSLGADHDDFSTSSCAPEEPDGTKYHMGATICSGSSAWSVCSKHCILQFVKTHASWCLTDIPTALDLTDPVVLPGQVYTAAQQCRINFELETYACMVGEFCKRLFCKINEKECVSTGDPPAQGTRCGPNMWCFNRRCVHRGTRPGATNGEWGAWSQWNPCSKTCGGGVQTAHRACDSPPPSLGGKLCPGPWAKSRMCNVGSCPDAGKGFLDQQCQNTNSQPYRGKLHEWMYFNRQVEELKCVVICINEKNEVAIRNTLALDGTFCTPGSKDVCIRGACKSVGCDWVIESNAKEDACGICHGNGTECRIMQGYFGDHNAKGKIEFLKLPIGTSMILVREVRPSPCFFVITNSMNSSSYLNNENEDQLIITGTFSIYGAVGVYQVKANMERVYIKDTIGVPITISTVCVERESNLGILYQYALPEPNTPLTIPTYNWEFLAWEKCPFPCGGGAQRAKPVCVEQQGGEVEDCYCVLQPKPPDKVRICNPIPCEARWWVGPWANCECFHNEGITTRMTMCAHLKEARNVYILIVPESECRRDPKPRTEKPCDPGKEQELWTKEKRKRDLTDMIPYSDAVEDYSVWDDGVDDQYPYKFNVKKVIHSLDPEDVEDYAYLKRIGMTNNMLEKIQGSQQHNISMRRRRQKSTNGLVKTEKIEKSLDKKHKKGTRDKKLAKDNEGETTVVSVKKKHNTEVIQKKTEPKSLQKVMTEESGAKHLGIERETAKPAASLDVTEKPRGREKIKERGKIKEVSVIPKARVHTTKIPGSLRLATQGRKHTDKINESVTQVAKAATTQSAVTAIEVTLDPGLTPYTMIASETPSPQKKCMLIDIVGAKNKSECRPIDEKVPEPAEAAPEMDYMNASKVKIYLVPIMTTIRTIVQNDQEFVLMETMAKYPVGDELNVVEHWGDDARREMKLARDRQNEDTKKPALYD